MTNEAGLKIVKNIFGQLGAVDSCWFVFLDSNHQVIDITDFTKADKIAVEMVCRGVGVNCYNRLTSKRKEVKKINQKLRVLNKLKFAKLPLFLGAIDKKREKLKAGKAELYKEIIELRDMFNVVCKFCLKTGRFDITVNYPTYNFYLDSKRIGAISEDEMVGLQEDFTRIWEKFKEEFKTEIEEEIKLSKYLAESEKERINTIE